MSPLRPLVLACAWLSVGILSGCDGGGDTEAEAAKALAPKPMTPERKATLERVKAGAPGGAPAATPGH